MADLEGGGQISFLEWMLAGLPPGLALLRAYAAVVLANFVSHTAAANILVPLGATMAVGSEVHVAVPIALASSCAPSRCRGRRSPGERPSL